MLISQVVQTVVVAVAALLEQAEHQDPPQFHAGPTQLPLQSFPDLLASLSTLTAIELEYEQVPGHAIPMLSAMTPLHSKAFELLDLEPHPAPALAPPPRADPPAPSVPA